MIRWNRKKRRPYNWRAVAWDMLRVALMTVAAGVITGLVIIAGVLSCNP